MSKRTGKLAAVISLFALVASGCTGCSTTPPARSSREMAAFALGAPAHVACLRWSKNIEAHVSFVSVSGDGTRVLASSSDPLQLRMLDESGKTIWNRPLKEPVHAQAISSDASLAVLSTYEGKTVAYDRRGRVLWEHDALGSPILLERSRLVLLVNDDDSDPGYAFWIYDWAGHLRAQLGTKDFGKKEPIDIAVADGDESFVATLLEDGTLLTHDASGRLLGKIKAPSGSIALAAEGGANPRIYVLGSGELLAFKAESSKVVPGMRWRAAWSTRQLPARFEDVLAKGETVFLYANTQTAGQALAAFDGRTGDLAWSRKIPLPAAYSSPLFTGSTLSGELPTQSFLTAILDLGQEAGTLNVTSIGAIKGEALWSAKIKAEDGIFSYAVTPDGKTLAVGAGESTRGTIETFKLRPHCP